MSEVLRAGYKLTEVGVIPKDWEASTIGKNTHWMSGGTPSRSNSEFWSGNIPWISGSTLKTDEISTSDQFLTAEAVSVGSKMAPLKSTLLLVRGSALHNEIRAGLVVFPVAFNQDVKALVPNFSIEPKFLTYYILGKNAELLKLVSSAGNSAGVLDTQLVQNFKFLKPPLPEQRAIAAALSDIDTLLSKLDTLITKKRNIKQATMQQLLTGQTRLPGFSREWEVKSFGEIFDYLPTATNARSDLADVGDTYYIHYGDIHTRFHSHLDFRNQRPSMILVEKCRNAALLKNGDWVMADASEDYDGVGKSIEISGLAEGVKAVAGLHTFLLREKTPTFAAGFKGHLGNLKSLHLQYLKVATGMKVFGVSKKALSNLNLQIPTLKEQTAISAILSDMDTELATLEARRDKTHALKQGMMQELLTGRIRLV